MPLCSFQGTSLTRSLWRVGVRTEVSRTPELALPPRSRSLKTDQHAVGAVSRRGHEPADALNACGSPRRVHPTDQVVDVLLGLGLPESHEGTGGARRRRPIRGCAGRSPCGAFAPLPRKEVIQPQLPLRLPCYDFTPIADPTFDGCLPCGLAHRLRVLPTFVV